MSHGDHGQTTVLVLGMVLVVFAVSGLAIDGTRAFLFRRTLQNAADGSSLAAASELDTDAFYSSGGDDMMLDARAARAAALDTLARRGIDATATIEATEEHVAVIVRGEIRTTFLRLIGVSSLPVTAEAWAEPNAPAG